jgi:Uma2 family endonuclease
MLVIPVLTETLSVKGPPQGQWTRADWEKLPDDGNRYEVIDGVLYMSTAPSWFHQWIIQQLIRFLGFPALEKGLAYVMQSPIGVFMPGCEPVQPDFVLILTEHASIIHDKRIFGVPDLIVEILSPSNADYDEVVKLTAYANAGVPEYVIIDPAARQLHLYRLEKPGQYAPRVVFNERDTVTFACLPTIPLLVGKLFEGSPDTTL